jgi:broad specificity phosphatase PhoE
VPPGETDAVLFHPTCPIFEQSSLGPDRVQPRPQCGRGAHTPGPAAGGTPGRLPEPIGPRGVHAVRAVHTGTIVAQALGLPLAGWLDWHEGGGVYLEDEETGERAGLPGNDRAYFAEHFPACMLPDDFGEGGWWHERPYESHEERQARARRVLQGLLERHGGTEDRVAVISHGNFYNYLLGALLGMPVREGYWLLMNNVAITRIDFEAGETALIYCNHAGFLPDELIT